MLKPAYKVKIGSETFEPGTQSPLVSVRVSQDIDIPAARARNLEGGGRKGFDDLLGRSGFQPAGGPSRGAGP